MSGRAPIDALLPALGRLDALLAAVAAGEPAPASIVAAAPGEPPSRLTQLGDALGLERFDLDVLLLALAPDFDAGHGRLFAVLQGDPAATRPSVETLLALLCPTPGERLARRARLGATGPLLAFALIEPSAGGVRPAARLLAHLLGDDGLDPALAGGARLVEGVAPDPTHAALLGSLGAGDVLVLAGPPEAGAAEAAAALAAATGRSLLLVDAACAWPLARREAAMAGALLCVVAGPDAVALDGHHEPLLVVAPDAGAIEDIVTGDVYVVDVCAPGPAARRARWERALGEPPADADLAALASRFRLSPAAIDRAARDARARARVRHDDLRGADLFAAARGRASRPLDGLARRLQTPFAWDDLVLPDDSHAQLRELCARVERRDVVVDEWGFRDTVGAGLGVSALFAGGSGTGKTMAASVVANALGQELFAIQLATIVSKYIGETSRNLDRIFAAAEHADAILLFDEADALFGKRSEVNDAHDRYANVEIAYLLQRMEAHEGVAILATNLRQNVDEAFARRLGFTVHFPFPGAAQRLEIWTRVWPARVALAGDVDLEDLAARFRLSGGNIRNAALAAAFLAAGDGTAEVRREHLLRAIRREYQKLGRGLSDAELTGVDPQLEAAIA